MMDGPYVATLSWVCQPDDVLAELIELAGGAALTTRRSVPVCTRSMLFSGAAGASASPSAALPATDTDRLLKPVPAHPLLGHPS